MQDTHSALRSGYGSRAAANRLQAANRSSESQLSEAGLRQSLEDEKKKVAEMSRCLQAAEAKSGELQSRLDAEVARSKVASSLPASASALPFSELTWPVSRPGIGPGGQAAVGGAAAAQERWHKFRSHAMCAAQC
eukprot:3048055-Rhodomonas_salina.1